MTRSYADGFLLGLQLAQDAFRARREEREREEEEDEVEDTYGGVFQGLRERTGG